MKPAVLHDGGVADRKGAESMPIFSVDENIEVRLLEECDAQRLSRLADGWESRPQVNEWLFPGSSPEAALEFIRGHRQRYTAGSGFGAGIWVRDDLAGVICLNCRGVLAVEVPNPVTASIDYALAPTFRGKGIITRACKAVVDYAFSNYPINRIEIASDAVNVKSCAIPERLGFVREGVLRQMVSYGSFFGDIVVYSLLRHEWETNWQPRQAH